MIQADRRLVVAIVSPDGAVEFHEKARRFKLFAHLSTLYLAAARCEAERRVGMPRVRGLRR